MIGNVLVISRHFTNQVFTKSVWTQNDVPYLYSFGNRPECTTSKTSTYLGFIWMNFKIDRYERFVKQAPLIGKVISQILIDIEIYPYESTCKTFSSVDTLLPQHNAIVVTHRV